MDPNQPTGPQYPLNQPPGYQQPGYPPPAAPYSQPMGQQAYGQYGAPPPPNRWGPTSLGMDANLAAGLGYLFPIIGVIFFFVERANRYVRFNAAQATLLAIGGFILGVLYLFGGVFTIFADRGGVGPFGLLLSCLFGLLGLGLFALQIWGIIVGFTGQYVKFPVIGQIAEQWAGGPPVAAY
jgi:uncharacterized membrane protein